MRSSQFVFVIVAAIFLSTSGCDITADPVPAYARISRPQPDQTIFLGEAFDLDANVEADAPVDSIVVRLQPKKSGAAPLRYRLSVPEWMRERLHPGNLRGVLDTTLVIANRPVEDVIDHHLMILTYTRNGGVGTSQVIPLRLVRRQDDQN